MDGLHPSFSAHVRWSEHGAAVRFPNVPWGLKSLKERAVVSHISRKASEMWGTRQPIRGKKFGESVRLKRPMRLKRPGEVRYTVFLPRKIH
jgi:hypothetical protein